MSRSLLPLALLLVVFAGCGRKTAVKPPEFAAPETIGGLSAENRMRGVRLTWPRPRTYADGSTMFNLAGFRVERSRDGADFELLAELPVTDRERFRQIRRFRYLDRGVVEGGQYQYRVLSFTLDGYVSEPSNVSPITRAEPTPTPASEPTPGATPPTR